MNDIDIREMVHLDSRGMLVSFQYPDSVPFEIKRVFYVHFSGKNVVRGNHANRNTKEMLISVIGNFKITFDFGYGIETKFLRSEKNAILVPEMTWVSQESLDENGVLLVLCSTVYESDQIRDYNKYREMRNERNESTSN